MPVPLSEELGTTKWAAASPMSEARIKLTMIRQGGVCASVPVDVAWRHFDLWVAERVTQVDGRGRSQCSFADRLILLGGPPVR